MKPEASLTNLKRSRFIISEVVSLLASVSVASGSQVLHNRAVSTNIHAFRSFPGATTSETRAWSLKNTKASVNSIATAGELTSVTPESGLTSGDSDLAISGASFTGAGFSACFTDPDRLAHDAFSNNTGFYGESIAISVPPSLVEEGRVYCVELMDRFGFSADRRFNVPDNGSRMVTNCTILNSGCTSSVLEFDITLGASGITSNLTRGSDAGFDTNSNFIRLPSLRFRNPEVSAIRRPQAC